MGKLSGCSASRGATLAFADSHMEHWKWQELKIAHGPNATTNPATRPDLLKLPRTVRNP
jgi:hypothetical protein